jgi:hypothetical protein
MFSIGEEEIKGIREAFDELARSDEETQMKFWTKVGLYDENGNIAERYRGLFEGEQ